MVILIICNQNFSFDTK